MEEEHYELFFETLANRLRMHILLATLRYPMTVKEITASVQEEQSKVSHALNVLKMCKLVHVKVQGREHCYEANREILVPLLRLVDAHSCKMCITGCDQYGRKQQRRAKMRKAGANKPTGAEKTRPKISNH
jgi:DNA-binding transcriptional ArsR family regulator